MHLPATYLPHHTTHTCLPPALLFCEPLPTYSRCPLYSPSFSLQNKKLHDRLDREEERQDRKTFIVMLYSSIRGLLVYVCGLPTPMCSLLCLPAFLGLDGQTGFCFAWCMGIIHLPLAFWVFE